MKPVKILSLEVENVKRVKALHLDCSGNLVVLGGRNRQGKTSVLDAICGALGGDKYKPSNAVRSGEQKGTTSIKLSNGVTVERRYTETGSYLKVDGPNGKGGQSLLNEFVSGFALDLRKFLGASDKEKADILLQVIGVDLTPMEEKYKALYQERMDIGRDELRYKKHAEAMPYHEGVPAVPLTAGEVMDELQAKLGKNAEKRRLRDNVAGVEREVLAAKAGYDRAAARVVELKQMLADAAAAETAAHIKYNSVLSSLSTAQDAAAGLQDEDTTDLQTKITELEDLNAKVRENLEREKAMAQSEAFHDQYLSKTEEIEKIRKEKEEILAGADLPLAGLSVIGGVLTLNGHAWDCMSHSDQLRAAVAITRRINPACGFVLLDKVEAMDIQTLREFGEWLESEGLQAICTRVSSGDECSIIIEDGVAVGAATPKTTTTFSDEDF